MRDPKGTVNTLKEALVTKFTVTAVDGRAVNYKDAKKDRAKTLRAERDDVKMFEQRGEC